MGQLRDQVFLHCVNKSLERVRSEFRGRFTPKKDNRFLIKGLTYEMSPCRIDSNLFIFDLSSKIPESLLAAKSKKGKYFKKVVALLKKEDKKPMAAKMENIVRNTKEEELKERDYVSVTYQFKESELYLVSDVQKRLKYHQSKNIPIPDVPGVATPSGKMVIILIEEGMAKSAKKVVQAMVKANDTVRQEILTDPPESTKKPAKRKAKAKAKTKKASKPKAKSKPSKKPAAKKKSTRKR
jgi:hypothetical protein